MTWKTYCGNLLWQSSLTLLVPQPQRLKRLNEIAIHQMRVLSETDNRNLLK